MKFKQIGVLGVVSFLLLLAFGAIGAQADEGMVWAGEEKPNVAIITSTPGVVHLFQGIPIEDRPVNFETYIINSRLINETIGCPEFDLTGYDLILFNTWRPNPWMMDRQVEPLRPFLQSAREAGAIIVFVDFIGDWYDEDGNKIIDPRIAELTTLSPADIPHVRILRDYFENAIVSGNVLNSLKFSYVHFLGGETDYALPGTMPLPGIYHPDYAYLFFENTADYIAWATETGRFAPDRPTIGIMVTRGTIRAGNTGAIDALIREIEEQGANVIVAFPYSMRRKPELWEIPLFYLEGERLVDAVIATRMCIPLIPYRRKVYYELGVQILSAVVAVGITPEEWRDDDKGLPLAMLGWAVPGIEFSGLINSMVIAARVDELDAPLLEQVERIVARAINHAQLGIRPNEDKRIAIVYFDYGVARTCKVTRGLNKPQSIVNLLKAMHKHNFDVELITEYEFLKAREQHGKTIPLYAQPRLDAMVANHRDEIVLIPVSEYREWLEEMIPSHRIEEVMQFWGEPEDGNMIVEYKGEPHIVLPMIKRGSVILLPEPGPCGGTVCPEIVFHEVGPAPPPHHQRIAFYLWLQREGIDAVVSLSIGTFATLPSRERALSYDCWPFLLSGHIPFVRHYSTDRSGIAMRSRRIGDMVVIGFMQPPIIQAGLHGSIGALRGMIFTYRETIEGPVRDAERVHVIKKAIEINIDKDMGRPGFKDLPHDAALIDKIDHHLEKVRTKMIIGGLHTLGQIPDQTLLSETIMLMLGPTFIDEIIKVGDIEERKEAEAKAKKLLMAVFNDQASPAAQKDILGNSLYALTDLLDEGRIHYQNFQASREIEATIDFLTGRFLMPGPSGDHIQNPDTLPTGRHLYTFDPRRFPTRGAWDVGRGTLQQMLLEHKERLGEFPDKLSFVVWASETKRHRGVVEAQILYAMGVEPVWDGAGLVRIDEGREGLRIIPDDELGRPRIDVTAIITGLYRNTFPCRVKVMDAAVRLVVAHEEKGQVNHVRRNYLALREELIEQGYGDEIAHNLATARVFGPPLEAAGARIGGIIKGSLTDDRTILADLFISQFAHIYSDVFWGKAREDISRRALSGTDVTFFSRSSPRSGLVGGVCCCASAFQGGLAMAIERIDGVMPEMMITDLRNMHNQRIVTTVEFMRGEVRATILNPRWIEAMMAEGFSGAREMHHIANHLWGWEGTTPHIVSEDIWNNIFEIYVEDRYNLNMREFFAEFHPHAEQAIIARLLEIINKGEWDAPAEAIEELVSRFLESVAEHGLTCHAAQCANPRLDQFIVEQVEAGDFARDTIARFNEQRIATLGIGLVGLEPAVEPAVELAVEAVELIVGEIIEVVTPEALIMQDIDLPVTTIVITILLVGIIGAGYMIIGKKKRRALP